MSSIPQEQQPLVAYPNTVPGQQHSNGSFGTVFIVLAVIIVISAIACFLGRLCSRKSQNQKAKASHDKEPQRKIQPESHKFRIRPKEEDIELGFDKMRSAKGGGLEFGFDKKRNPKEVSIEFGFDNKKRNPKEVGIEFGFDARPAGGNGGIVKPSED